jgi:hypothetical protein
MAARVREAMNPVNPSRIRLGVQQATVVWYAIDVRRSHEIAAPDGPPVASSSPAAHAGMLRT